MILATLAAALLAAPPQTLRHVDTYGLRTVDRAAVMEALGAGPGTDAGFDRDAARERIVALDGVVDAKLILVMFPGNEVLWVGIEEEGAPQLELRPAPTGDARLPDELVAAYDELLQRSLEGIHGGESAEDNPDGYSVPRYAPAREQQAVLRDLARAEAERLPRVLLESADAKHRAVAASALAYLDDKAALVPLLAQGMVDPDSGVRNNATRALSVLANWASDRPDFRVELDPAPLIAMLESLEWTDRNKAGALLLSLTKDRDPDLLAALRASALPALDEMARWHLEGYAFPSVAILARLAGLPEDTIGPTLREVTAAGDEARLAWIDELTAGARVAGEAADGR